MIELDGYSLRLRGFERGVVRLRVSVGLGEGYYIVGGVIGEVFIRLLVI